MKKFRLTNVILICALALNGCVLTAPSPGDLAQTYNLGKDVTKPITRTEVEEVRAALRENENSPQLRNIVGRVEESFLLGQLRKAENALQQNNLKSASSLYTEIVDMFPLLPIGLEGLKKTKKLKRHEKWLSVAKRRLQENNYAEAREIARNILLETPQYKEALKFLLDLEQRENMEQLNQEPIKPAPIFFESVDLNFRHVSIDTLLDALTSSLDVNFVVDRSISSKDMEVAIFVKDTPLMEALKLLADANDFRIKLMNEKTLLLFKNTPTSKHNKLSLRSFRLIHSDTNETAAMLAGLLDIKDIYVDEKLKLLVASASPEKIALANRLIAIKDIPDPMVLLELEVLEISRTDKETTGFQHPKNFNINVAGNSGDGITLERLRSLGKKQFILSPVPSLGIDLNDSISTTKLLANPRMRILNGETGSINIGDKLPLVNTVNNNGVTTQNVTFVNVGIILSFTPTILPNGEIILDINLEVSSVNDTINTGTNVSYQIGTRSFKTKVRVRDGETQVFGGLLRDEDRNVRKGLPFLLTNKDTQHNQTEIVLSVTPRLFDNIHFSQREDDRLFIDIRQLLQQNDKDSGKISNIKKKSRKSTVKA